MEINEIMERLSAPFPPDEVEWRITAKTKDNTKGLVAAYIDNRAVMNRLDEVIGYNNWQSRFTSNSDGAICELSLRINGEWITKSDGASNTDIEAIKGGLSNAMKRAAAQWGIGRYLYKLPGVWVKIQPKGRSYEIDEKPKLPSWALPSNHKQSENKNWTKEENIIALSKVQEDCINAFKELNVTKANLENYLNKETWAFDNNDILTLRNVYKQIANGKSKEDFFPTRKREKTQSANNLQAVLEGEVEK
jgi:hypothetical protein